MILRNLNNVLCAKSIKVVLISTFLYFFLAGCNNSSQPVSKGEKIFIAKCSRCHGADGKKGLKGAKDLNESDKSLAFRINQVKKGEGEMPSFSNRLSDEQIKLVSEYTINRFSNKKVDSLSSE